MNTGDQPTRRQGGALETFWRIDGGAVYAVVAGDVDMDNAYYLSSVLTAALRAASFRLTVDLTNLGFFGAAGVRVLVDLHSSAEMRGCRIELRGLPPTARRILLITDALRLFEVIETPVMTWGSPRPRPLSSG